MRRISSLSIAFALTLTLVLFQPVTAAAMPIPTGDPAVTFTAADKTAALEAAIGGTVDNITAIQTMYNDDGDNSALIAGFSGGDVFLAHYDFEGDSFSDWTSNLNSAYSDVTSINAIGAANGEYTWTIGGTADGAAFLVDACDYCVFGHSHDYATPAVLTHAAVSGIDAMYLDGAPAIGMAGVTVSGPTGFFLCDTEGETTTEVADAPMTLASGPVKWAGLSGVLGFTAQPVAQYWLTGGTGGSVLAYGAPTVPAQTYASLPGVIETLSIEEGPDGWMLGGRGADGYMKLFSDADSPTFEVTTATGPVALDLPQTMTTTLAADAAYPYYIVGGTGGGSGHLYKYKNIAGEFIDFDYLIPGMSGLNAIGVNVGLVPAGDIQPATVPISARVLVGGSGSSKLVLLTEVSLLDETPVPAGGATTKTCGDGSASVDVPAGAINSDYLMQVEKVATGTPDAPSGFSLLGNSYEFDCYDTSGNPITTFDGPVTITIYYDEADLNGMSEDSLQIYWYNPATPGWEAVTPCVVDKVNNTVTIQITHFSQFAILGMNELPYTGS